MYISENGLETSSVYITFENDVLHALIQTHFPAPVRCDHNFLGADCVAVNEGDFAYRGGDTIENAHKDDFFLAPQKERGETHTEWELPLGPKTPELFAPLLARIIENNFPAYDGKTALLVNELILEKDRIGQAFTSFTWEHTDAGETTDDEGEECYEEVVTKFVLTGGKVKRSRRKKKF